MSGTHRHDPRPAIGIDLGASQVRAALIEPGGQLLARAACPTDTTGGPQAVVAQIQRLVREVTSGLGGGGLEAAVSGVGVCSPGPLDAQAGVVACIPTLAGWIDVPLVADLQRALQVGIRLENDGVAAALGEWRFGAAQGLADVVYVTVSTGIGGGVIANGRILRGRRNMAAHVGHMTTEPQGGVCDCGNRGCWEAQASGTSLARIGRERAAREPASRLHAMAQTLTAREIFDAARSGDALALQLVEDESAALGLGLVNLLHLFSPQLIVMGGGVSQGFDLLQPGIARAIERRAMAPFKAVRVVPAALGANAGLVGAASLVMSAYAQSPSQAF